MILTVSAAFLVKATCSSFAIGGPFSEAGVAAYDAPSLPPGMQKWQTFEQGKGPWYRWANLQGWELLSDIVGLPKTNTGIDRNSGEKRYWWVPEGTTNLTMGPWFPGGSSTTRLVTTAVQPPSPGRSLDLDRPFDCAVYDATKKGWCYERVPHESQRTTTLFELGLGPEFAHHETSRCTLRWVFNVLMKRHEPSGSLLDDYPEWEIKRGGHCIDVGYWGPAVLNPMYHSIQARTMVNLHSPFDYAETAWNLMYTAGFQLTSPFMNFPVGTGLGIPIGIPIPFGFMGEWNPIRLFGAAIGWGGLRNTYQKIFYTKSIHESWKR